MVNLPSPLAHYERSSLLFSNPSPLERLSRFSTYLKGNHKILVNVLLKREDCNSGMGLGGNKIRKLVL